MAKKQFPSREQLKMLKESGWRRTCKGLAWQSPYDKYFYSPQAAAVREERKQLLQGNTTQIESRKGTA